VNWGSNADKNLTAGAIALLMVWTSSQTLQARALSPLTVCEVLQNLNKYRGKIIGVRGESTLTICGQAVLPYHRRLQI